MPRRTITVRATYRVRVQTRVTYRQTTFARPTPSPSLPPMRTVSALPSSTTRRVISRSGGGGDIDDLYVAPPGNDRSYDVFISYASEDREVAAELASELRALDITTWFDQTVLSIGMGLRRSIDQGLASSRFGVVLMTHSFFTKEWPQRELDGLVSLEVGGRQRILPIWHGLGHDDVLRYSPTLADKIAARTSAATIKEIAAEIARAIRGQ